jgi:type VI secretion system secreted protein Hcp
MASIYLLELVGFTGECHDDKHPGAIEIESFSWGLTNSVSSSSGGGGGAGRATFQDFHFTKKTDSTSPTLFISCATGRHIKKATLTVRKAGKDQLEFMTIKLTDVFVTSFSNAGDKGDNDPPEDAVSITFAKIEFSETSQDDKGRPGTTVTEAFDVKGNRGA